MLLKITRQDFRDSGMCEECDHEAVINLASLCVGAQCNFYVNANSIDEENYRSILIEVNKSSLDFDDVYEILKIRANTCFMRHKQNEN